MTKKRFKHSEIQAILDQAVNCRDLSALCTEHGITFAQLSEWQEKQSKDGPEKRSRVITPGGYKPKTIGDYYRENLGNFPHISTGYD